MAPKKGSDDIGWQRDTMLGSRHNFKCNYCSFTRQGGGVSRLKKHFAGGRLVGYHDVQGCKMVLSEVKRFMIDHLKHVRVETARKRADKEMQERIILGRERDEDIEDEVEMYAEYVPDLDVQERRGRAQSRAEAWEADQRAAYRVSFQGAQHEVGNGSGSGSEGGTKAKSEAYFSPLSNFSHNSDNTEIDVVTYGPLVVASHARNGYLATPIVFGDFSAVVGSPFFLGVLPAIKEAQKQ
ncbi:hypothetical protein Taro_019272 [Colocasia esculenta]|uniref:BED-type domain-containing protein n=1 Tax=Colocasia esculenta TaxID=4460 RepID=A0A843V506_COLES|nr:hypothetical protein [Colocasia esculenta]